MHLNTTPTYLEGQVLLVLESHPMFFVKILSLDDNAAIVRYCTERGIETGTSFPIERSLLLTDTKVHAQPARQSAFDS